MSTKEKKSKNSGKKKSPARKKSAPKAAVAIPPKKSTKPEESHADSRKPSPPANPPKKIGRPTVYSEDVALRICMAIAVEDLSLRDICKQEGIPALSTIMEWAMDAEHPFAEQYARARKMQAELRVDELDVLAKSALGLLKLTPTGECVDPGAVAAIKLLIDTRKWSASKVLPKVYGDKLEVTGDMKFIPLSELAAQTETEPEDE